VFPSVVDEEWRPLNGKALNAIGGVACTVAVASELGGVISIEVFGVCILALAALLIIANLLRLATVTHQAARIIIGRVVNAGHNWDTEPLRSFLESFGAFSVVISCFASTQRVGVSLLCGVASGLAIIFCGEVCTAPIRALEDALLCAWGHANNRPSPAADKRPGEKQRIGCSLSVLCLYGWGALRLIWAHTSDLVLASTVSSLVICAVLMLSRLLVACAPTRDAGELLQDRVLRPSANWSSHPLRSAIELSVTLGVALSMFGATGALLPSLQAAVLFGILTCGVHEAIASAECRAAARHAAKGLGKRALPYALGTAAAFALFTPIDRAAPTPAM